MPLPRPPDAVYRPPPSPPPTFRCAAPSACYALRCRCQDVAAMRDMQHAMSRPLQRACYSRTRRSYAYSKGTVMLKYARRSRRLPESA
jgi:hypothetical protein